MTFNVQSYFDSPSFVNFALTGTASVGWNKKIGEKLDFFAAVGFDKNISNVREYGKFSDAAKIYPGKLAFDLGFNFRLGKKAAEIAD